MIMMDDGGLVEGTGSKGTTHEPTTTTIPLESVGDDEGSTTNEDDGKTTSVQSATTTTNRTTTTTTRAVEGDTNECSGTTAAAVETAKLRSKLKQVLQMKRNALQQKLEISKQGTTTNHHPTKTTNSLNPITAILQLASRELWITNIGSRPDHLTRFYADKPFEGVLYGGRRLGRDRTKKEPPSTTNAVDQRNDGTGTAAPSNKDGDLAVGVGPLVSAGSNTTLSSTDGSLKKRKLELQMQLAHARLKRSRLEQQQQTQQTATAVEQESSLESKQEGEREMTGPDPKRESPPEPSSLSREELLQKKRALEFRSNVENLKHIVSKQEVLMYTQEDGLVATEQSLAESETALVELKSKLGSVQTTIATCKIRERALIEMEEKQNLELEEATNCLLELQNTAKES